MFNLSDEESVFCLWVEANWFVSDEELSTHIDLVSVCRQCSRGLFPDIRDHPGAPSVVSPWREEVGHTSWQGGHKSLSHSRIQLVVETPSELIRIITIIFTFLPGPLTQSSSQTWKYKTRQLFVSDGTEAFFNNSKMYKEDWNSWIKRVHHLQWLLLLLHIPPDCYRRCGDQGNVSYSHDSHTPSSHPLTRLNMWRIVWTLRSPAAQSQSRKLKVSLTF